MTRDMIQESFSINLFVMRIFGLYHPHKYKFLHVVLGYVMYFVCIIPIPICGCVYLLLEEDVDLVKVSENAFLLAEMGCYFGKFLPFLINGDKIKSCILYFDSPLIKTFSDNHTDMLEDCKQICRRNTTIFLISVIGGVTSWAIKPFFLKEYRLPVDVWLPFDPLANTSVYYATYLFLIIQVMYAAFSSGVTDPLISGLACQATGQLKILKFRLQHLFEKEKVYEEIKLCVNYHNAILEFVKNYEECFSLVVFSQFVGSVIVICVSCLALSFMESFSFNFCAMMMYLIVMLLEIYLFCYYGTTLYEESETIADSIYMGRWYEYNAKSKQALLVLMERSQRPMSVTTGKILDLSLVTFTTILRRSYSLLAVLQNYK